MKLMFDNFTKFSICALTFILMACHGAQVKKESEPAQPASEVSAKEKPADSPSDPSTIPPPSRERILESFSYLQMVQAASAYKIVADENMAKGPEVTQEPVFGCAVETAESKSAGETLRDLIDAKMPREQTSYLRGPKTYLKTRMSSECVKSCTCGAILDVLSSVDVRVLSKSEQSRHEELLLELQSKSSKQGPEATMECARAQKWICKSDLQKYLKARSFK